MSGSFSNLDLRVLDEPGLFLVVNSPTYKKNSFKYSVPVGFKTDLASIPAALRPFFSRTGKNRKPAVFHDHMYTVKFKTRQKCDEIFRQMLRDQGVGNFRAYLYYVGVRAGGWTRGSW